MIRAIGVITGAETAMICKTRAAFAVALVLASLSTSAKAESLPAYASLAGDVLSGAIIFGAVMFCTLAAHLFLQSGRRTRSAEAQYTENINALQRRADLTDAIMRAEAQALVVCDQNGGQQLIAHTLSPATGAPSKLRALMRFHSWAAPESAALLDTRFKQLRETGEPFVIGVKTLSGGAIEAEGRASGAICTVKFRDLGARRQQVSSLMAKVREQADDLAAHTALLDALPLPVWFRGADGQLKWVNGAYAASVEAASPQDAVAGQVELLETRQRAKINQEVAKGAVFRSRLQTVVAGGRKTFETVVAPAGEGSAGAAIDLAPLETAKDKLSRLMAAHARTLDRVSAAVSIFGPDRRLAFYNRSYLEFWGMEAEWLDARPTLSEILDHLRQTRQLPEQRDYRVWRDEQLKAYESAEGREDCWHLPDGRSVFVVADQRPDGVTFLYEDVTEKFALERQYNSLIHVQRETLDHLREGVAVFGSDARLKLFNPVFAAMWRVNASILNREPHIEEIAILCRPLSGEDPWTAARQAITSLNEKRQPFDGYLNRTDGSVIAYAGVPLPDGATLLTYIDITDRKRVEQALIERNEALEAADRLKNAFISHVSRELRTPLTNIIGFSELLASEHFGELNAKQREYLNDIRSSSVALLSIINDILDLAVIDAGALELTLAPVTLRDVIDAAELGVRDRLAKTGLKLQIQVDAEIGSIIADGQRLTQILFNLLSNAIGFSEEGSVITLNCRREGARIAFIVQDMGCGIPEEFQKTVFERFESRTFGSGHRGAGLGLSLVKSLVEMHGGEIKLRSAPGAGTTITVLIPDAGPKRYNLEAGAPKATKRAGQKTISAIISA
jgi:signal transduction histidine kinase